MDAKQNAIGHELRRHGRRFAALALTMLAGGCASLQQAPAVPASRVPPALLGERRDNRERIDILRLRQDPPDVYLLAPRDILGIYVEGITGGKDGVAPVNYPESGDLPPSIGWPIPVREDGTLTLPQADPVKVEGLTIVEAEELVKRAYVANKVFASRSAANVVVTIMRKRTVQVTVVREDSGAQSAQPENLYSSRTNPRAGAQPGRGGGGFTIDLRAYENDVLHALNQTGGMPKDDAKNEVIILRGNWKDAADRDRQVAAAATQDEAAGLLPRKKARDRWAGNPNVTRIPLRYDPKKPPRFDEDEIILREGDVVIVEGRDRDVFYTGGLLQGGEIPLPRDRDLDVLGAIALSGGTLGGGFGSGRSGGFGGGGGLGGQIPASEVVIIRDTDCGNITMKVNLTKAYTDPTLRVLIQPGDLVILRYTTGEQLANALFSVVNFNFLFSGLGRRF